MENGKSSPMKKIVNTRFGEIEYDPEKIISFPKGLIGLPNLHDFVVMPNKKDGPLFWIQCVNDPDFAFVLTDPTNFFLDYKVIPDDEERKRLGMGKKDSCHALAIVTVHQDRTLTINLMAPILYAPDTNQAIQVILEKSQYTSNTPLPTA